MKILVTGAGGLIGSAVRRALEGTHELTALGRNPVPGLPTTVADLADARAIAPAFAGVDTVVHLAAGLPHRRGSSWDDMLGANIVGAYNVFAACRDGGVKRVLFASSGAVIGGWEREPPYDAVVSGAPEALPASWPMLTHDTPLRPNGIYACTKIFGEALGRYYADSFGLSVIVLRFGHVTEDDQPDAKLARSRSIWCSQRDAAQMVTRCVDAPDSVRFEIFYVASKNRLGYRDLEHARRVVGFVPLDGAD